MKNLDLYDKKIMKLLIENCRYPITKIAKAVNRSKDSVNYRIKQLENNSFIYKYNLMTNPKNLGYSVNHLLLKLKSISPSQKELILKNLKAHKNVTFISSQAGIFDMQIIFHCRDIFQGDIIIQEILEILDKKIRDYKLVNHLEDYNFSFLYSDVDVGIQIKQKNDTSFSKALQEPNLVGESMKFDRIDKMILKELMINPLEKIINISKKLLMSNEGVKKRIMRLIKNNVISGFSMYPNYQNISFFTYMLLFKLKPLPQETEKKLKIFFKSNFVLYAGRFNGEYNIFVYILAKDPLEFNEKFKELQKIIDDNIIDYDLSILTDIHKFVMISKEFLEN